MGKSKDYDGDELGAADGDELGLLVGCTDGHADGVVSETHLEQLTEMLKDTSLACLLDCRTVMRTEMLMLKERRLGQLMENGLEQAMEIARVTLLVHW